jgi:hypothetical protein
MVEGEEVGRWKKRGGGEAVRTKSEGRKESGRNRNAKSSVYER